MSRIGKQPIAIPEKVKIDLKPGLIEVVGPLGKMTQRLPPNVKARQEGNILHVELDGLSQEEGGHLHGLGRSLIYNAVVGVTQGFKKDLEIVGLGYRAAIAGDKLNLSLGFAHPIEFKLPVGIKVTVDPKQTQLSVSGVDSYLVGETAARIRRLKKPEPYKGSGIRYAGEHVRRKAGKAAAGAVGGAKK